jgi:hypothetical protein
MQTHRVESIRRAHTYGSWLVPICSVGIYKIEKITGELQTVLLSDQKWHKGKKELDIAEFDVPPSSRQIPFFLINFHREQFRKLCCGRTVNVYWIWIEVPFPVLSRYLGWKIYLMFNNFQSIYCTLVPTRKHMNVLLIVDSNLRQAYMILGWLYGKCTKSNKFPKFKSFYIPAHPKISNIIVPNVPVKEWVVKYIQLHLKSCRSITGVRYCSSLSPLIMEQGVRAWDHRKVGDHAKVVIVLLECSHLTHESSNCMGRHYANTKAS